MVLIDSKTRKPLSIGDKVVTFRGENAVLVGVQEPRHEGSTGRVEIQQGCNKYLFYPSVINAEWLR